MRRCIAPVCQYAAGMGAGNGLVKGYKFAGDMYMDRDAILNILNRYQGSFGQKNLDIDTQAQRPLCRCRDRKRQEIYCPFPEPSVSDPEPGQPAVPDSCDSLYSSSTPILLFMARMAFYLCFSTMPMLTPSSRAICFRGILRTTFFSRTSLCVSVRLRKASASSGFKTGILTPCTSISWQSTFSSSGSS